jgi:hypothetical protein
LRDRLPVLYVSQLVQASPHCGDKLIVGVQLVADIQELAATLKIPMLCLVLRRESVGDCPLWIENDSDAGSIPVALSAGLEADLLDWNDACLP